MKYFKSVLFVALLGILAGCSVDFDLMEKRAGTISSAIKTADPIVAGFENAVPGYEGLNPEGVSKAEKIVGGIATGAAVVKGGAEALEPFAGPTAGTVGKFAGLLASLALNLGLFLRNRKVQAATETLVKAVNPVPGIGKKINQIAAAEGTAATISEIYHNTDLNKKVVING